MPILLAVSWQPEAREKLQLFNRQYLLYTGTPQFITCCQADASSTMRWQKGNSTKAIR